MRDLNPQLPITVVNPGADDVRDLFILPSVAALTAIDLKSQKPALKHLRDQFLEVENEEPILLLENDEDNNSDCGSIYESNRGGDSPMEIKSATPFVRHGFGRVSTTSSSYLSSENPNGVDEMSAESESQKITTVKHCISKYNQKTKEENNRMQSKSFLATIYDAFPLT